MVDVLPTKPCSIGWNRLEGTIRGGAVSILPAILLILMASSAKYTLTEGKVLDTVLYRATSLMQQLPIGVAVLFLYRIALIMNFFIASDLVSKPFYSCAYGRSVRYLAADHRTG